MNKKIVIFPYKIGTRFCLEREDGTVYHDQIAKYVVKKDGIYVILWLCIDKDPRLSVEIPLDEFLKLYKKPTKEAKTLKKKPKLKESI